MAAAEAGASGMSAASPPRYVLLGHISRALLARIGLCAFILISLMEILALLEQTTAILQRNLGIHGILTYALLHLPVLILQALPLSVLIGAVFMLTQMALGSEIASLRAAGLSTVTLFVLMLPGTVGVAIGGMVMHEFVAPHTELALARWWNVTSPTALQDTRGFWFHDHGSIVHVDHFSAGGTILHGVDYYRRNAKGALEAVSSARQAEFRQSVWEATSLRQLDLNTNRVVISQHATETITHSAVSPDNILILSQPYPVLSTRQIEAILHQGAPASLPKATYRMALFEPYILPMNLCVMLLLALPVVYIPPRTGTRSMMPVAALGAGFAFIVMQGLVQALGNAGTLPALLATLAPPILATLLAVAWLLKMEER